MCSPALPARTCCAGSVWSLPICSWSSPRYKCTTSWCVLLALTVLARGILFLVVALCVIVLSTPEAHKRCIHVVGYLISHACSVSMLRLDSIVGYCVTIQGWIWQRGSPSVLFSWIWYWSRLRLRLRLGLRLWLRLRLRLMLGLRLWLRLRSTSWWCCSSRQWHWSQWGYWCVPQWTSKS